MRITPLTMSQFQGHPTPYHSPPLYFLFLSLSLSVCFYLFFVYAATSARSDRRARFSSLQRKRVRIRGAVRLRDQRVGVWGVLGLGGNRLRICRGTLQTAWPKPSESLRPPTVLQRLLRHLSPAKRDAPPPSPKRRPETAGRRRGGRGGRRVPVRCTALPRPLPFLHE